MKALLTTVLLALLLAPVASARLDPGTPPARDARVAAAEYVAGHSVTISCEPLSALPAEILAYVFVDGSYVIHLGPYACAALEDPTTPIFGAGLFILAHEAYHLAGVSNETAASCAAVSEVEHLARRFWRVENQNVKGAAQRLYGMTSYARCP